MSIRRRRHELSSGDLIFLKPGRYLCEKSSLGMRLLKGVSRGLLVEYCGENSLSGKASKRCWKVLVDGVVFLIWEEMIFTNSQGKNEDN